MDAINEKLNQLKNLQLIPLLEQIAKENETYLLKLMTKSQIYEKGQSGTGEKIKPINKPYNVYSANYEKLKARRGLYQGHIDLFLTGQWLRSWFCEFESDGFILAPSESEADLTDKLKNQYGAEILEMSPEIFEELRNFFKDEIIKKIKEILL